MIYNTLFEDDNEDVSIPPYIENSKFFTGFTIFFIIFILIWALIGLIAFIMSLVCFGRSGTLLEKTIGLLLAIFFGPLYFIFYMFNASYCR